MLLTTRQVAKKLGMNYRTLARYLALKKIPEPKTVRFVKFRIHWWTPKEIERLRGLAPKIFNKRMRYQGKPIPGGAQQLAKAKSWSKRKRK